MSKKIKPVPVTIVHEQGTMPEPYRPKDSLHMSIRQIENGFIVNRHGHKDGKHFDEELFTPHMPQVGMRSRAPRQARPAPAPAPAPMTEAPRERKSGRAPRRTLHDYQPATSPYVDPEDFQKGPSAKELPKKLKAMNRDKRLMKVKL